MAANTAVSITLNARDWEALISAIDGNQEDYLLKLKYTLTKHYEVNVNPAGGTPIVIATKEKAVVRIFELLWGGNSINYMYSDLSNNPFKRIMDALRLSNNIADNYISTALGVIDTNRDASGTAFRKRGRAILQMEAFDNS